MQSSSRTSPPVVLVVMDELDANMLMNSKQRIDRTRYPNFAALARTSTWYRNATTVSGQTSDAVPALLAASRPRSDALPVAADYPNSVFRLLGESHAMRVTETATELSPSASAGPTYATVRAEAPRAGLRLSVVSLHLLLPEGLRRDLPAVDRTFGDFRTREPAPPRRGRPDQQPRGSNRLLRGSEAARGQVRSRHRPPRRSTRLPLPTRGVSGDRGSICLPDNAMWPTARRRLGSSTRDGQRSRSQPASGCSDTCCRLATRIGWSRGSSDASGARPFSIAPWSSSPPTMASAFAPVVHAG